MGIMDLWLEDEDKANKEMKKIYEDQNLTEAGLTKKELAKYAKVDAEGKYTNYRIELILSMIKDGKSFELTKNRGTVKIPADKNQEFIDILTKGLEEPNTLPKTIYFYDSEGKRRPTGHLRKTRPFGGGGGKKGPSKEEIARGSLENLLKKALKDSNTDAIILRILDKNGNIIAEFDDVIGNVPTTRGTPKSDFEIQRKDGKPDIFVSHKDGTYPADFSQWGGTAEKAGEQIMNHPEVQRFAKDVRKRVGVSSVGEGLFEFHYPKKISFGRKIKDDKLKKMAIFGQNYSSDGDGGINNVDLVVQGFFTLTRAGSERTKDDKEIENVYILGASHIAYRKNLKGDLLSGPYEPILVTRFASDRQNHGIRYCRMMTYPQGGRKYTEI